MVAVDTNVIVRLLTGDDQAQYQAAYALFENERILIPTTVILETEWVLRYAYGFSTEAVDQAFRSLFGLANVELEDPMRVADVLNWYVRGMDFADALHLLAALEADGFRTFDKKLIARAKELVDLPVNLP